MLVFPKDALVTVNGFRLTDHNRSPLEISVERIAKRVRMANGTMRQYHIADKRTFSMSWTMLPNQDSKTVDGFWGANSINSFFNDTEGEFELGVVKRDGSRTIYRVFFTDYGRSLTKRRGDADYYDVNLTLEQV